MTLVFKLYSTSLVLLIEAFQIVFDFIKPKIDAFLH